MSKKKAGGTIASVLTELASRLEGFVRLEPTCIKCGCTEYSPCDEGCAWTFLNSKTNEGMCSACSTMSGKVVVIEPDGTMTVIEREAPSLPEMQQLVGGYVECITMDARWGDQSAQIYCNEEGKLQGLATNTVATFYVHDQVPHFADVLVGTVVVLIGKAGWK